MSEQENLRIVQEGYADFGRGDIQTLLTKFAEDVVWVTPGEKTTPLGGTYKGRDAVAGFFKKLNDLTEISSFVPREFLAQGNKVIVFGNESGRVKATGRTFESEWVMVFTMQNGEVTSFQEYGDTANWAVAFGTPQAMSA